MNVIIKPLVTEKMTKTTEKRPSKFGFIVDKEADKPAIKKAVEELYDVKVVKVNTSIAPAKKRNRYTRHGVVTGSVSSFKKAIVTLEEGQKIDFYSSI